MATAIAVTTTIIAAIVAFLTYSQFRIQRDNLKLALFERRAAIYTSAKKLIVDAISGIRSEKEELISFYWKVGESRFLLSEDLSKLIEQILKNVTELNHVGSMAEATERKPEEQGCFLKRHAEIREWLIAQQQPLLEKFKPFLSDWST